MKLQDYGIAETVRDCRRDFATSSQELAGVEAVLSPGFQSLVVHRIAHLLQRKRRRRLAKLVQRFARIVYSIDIHPAARIGGGCVIVHGTGLVIGAGVIIGQDARLFHGVTLGLGSGRQGGFPELGDGVTVGCGACLLGGISVGSQAKIGANATVVSDVPTGSTVVGPTAQTVG